MNRRVEGWVGEVIVLTCCAVAFATMLFVVARSRHSDALRAAGSYGVTNSTSPSMLSSRAGDAPSSNGQTVGAPVQIHIRSPEAAPGLTNDSSGPLFMQTNMTPGTTSTRCVAVSNVGQQQADIRIFGSVSDGGLGPYVQLAIEVGRGGGYDACARFSGKEIYRGSLAGFATAHHAYRSGVAVGRDVAPGGSVSFRVTQRLAEGSPQGVGATATFAWQAQSAGAPSPLRGRDPFTRQPADRLAPAPVREDDQRLRDVVLRATVEVIKRGWSWVLLLCLVVLFLVIQDRIDRRDPRLAGARIYPEPELPFTDLFVHSPQRSETNA